MTGKIEVVKHARSSLSKPAHSAPMSVGQHIKHIVVSIVLVSQEANKIESGRWHGLFHSIMKKTMMILWACKSSSSTSTQGTVLFLADCGECKGVTQCIPELANLLGLWL